MFEYKNLNAVIGYPLTHTQSPVLHNAVYRALNIDAVLLPFASPDLGFLIAEIKAKAIGLTAVTMPFKQAVLSYLYECSPQAQALKAVNTLIQREGKLYGYNTDVDGIAYALGDTIVAHKKVLIVGAGGAARAMGYYMQSHDAELFCLNRSQDNGIKMAKDFGGEILTPKQAYQEVVDIIVNTTPLGMYPDVNASPLPDYPFHPAQTVFDLVYNPVDTLLLKQAQKAGAKVISGMDMFIAQGLKQIELWRGFPSPLVAGEGAPKGPMGGALL